MAKTPLIYFTAWLLLAAGCATDPTLGGGSGNVASGSAAGTTTTGANNQLEHCGATLGTVTIDEDQEAPWFGYLYQQYKLPSTVPLLRLIVQQSNCFVIVDRGRAYGHATQERDISRSGEGRAGSSMGKGQIVAADYTITPSINFSQQGTGGVGAALGFVPYAGPILGGLAASARSNEASTTLLLVDNRSTVQLGASQGSAKNWDIGGLGGLAGFGSGGFGGGAIGGYSNTPEGKILTAAFMDAYNNMVRSLREYKAQTVNGGLGAGGTLGVSGGQTPASRKLGQ
jgi:curli biogenesis system outer membrane secretion channel CsgG